MIYIFDCDRTLFDIYDAEGKDTCARDTKGPWKYCGINDDREKWEDGAGNTCILMPGLRKILRQICSGDNEAHVITHSMNQKTPAKNQSVFILLDELGLRKYFCQVIAVQGSKAKWASTLGKGMPFIFIDDEPSNLKAVSAVRGARCLHPDDFYRKV